MLSLLLLSTATLASGAAFLPAIIPQDSSDATPTATTSAAFTGPITPGPLRPWTNSTRPTTSAPQLPLQSGCFDCAGHGYSYASSCSVASQAWSSSSSDWWTAHYTISYSMLSSLTTYSTYIPSPPRRDRAPGCFASDPLVLISNVYNVTVVRPEYAEESATATDFYFPDDFPSCTINRLDCSTLWDAHEARPTAQPAPTCNDYFLNFPCFAPYMLPTDYSLEIPTQTWLVPSTGAVPPTTPTPTPAVASADIPAGLFAPLPQHSAATSPQPQQQPSQSQQTPQQQHQQQDPTQQQAPSSDLPAPLTTTTMVNNTPLTATIYPAQTLASTTLAPSVVVSGTTLLPSSPPVTIGGAVLSAEMPSGALVSITSSTIAPAFSTISSLAHPAGGSAQEQPPALEQITVAGHVFTATSSSSAIIFGPGSTAVVGGPAMTLYESVVTSSGSAASPDETALAMSPQGQPLGVVSAAPGGSIIVVAKNTVLAMPMSTGGADASPSSTQDSLSAGPNASGADPIILGTGTTAHMPSASVLSSSSSSSLASSPSTVTMQTTTTSSSLPSSTADSTAVPDATTTLKTTGASVAPSESASVTSAAVQNQQGAAASIAIPGSRTLFTATGMLALLHLLSIF